MSSTPKDHKDGSSTPDAAHHLHGAHQHGRRLLQFVRPNGVKVHIAHTPEQHDKLRQELVEQQPNGDFDVLIHGTPEHLMAVRELHAHHEARQDTLREKHGHVYEEFEHVKDQLDQLSSELHIITDHGVSLDANFSKFGYSAHLRTKENNESESSPGGDDSASLSKHLDRSASALKFWRRPTIRQYFHKGLLWRSSRSGEVASFELFVDLLYVGVIGIIGDTAAEVPSGKGIVEYIVVMCLAWKIWNDATMIVNWFEIDDITQRLSMLFYVICLFGFTVNIAYAFESTYTAMIAFYICQRLFAATWFLWVAYLLPTITGTLVYNTVLVYFSSALWIGSIHVAYPNQLALIFLAMFVDLFGATALIWVIRYPKLSLYERYLKKYFEFYPAINIEHRVERINAFISLVFGYSVLTILFQNRAVMPMNAFLGKGILGLIQAFCFNWIYFEIDAYSLHVHAIRRHWASSIAWVSAHLPLVMGYVLAAATLSKLVLAHDCTNTEVESLGDAFVNHSEPELSAGIRWYYCGGIGVALISMAVISFCHVHKKLKHPRLQKRPRLLIRLCVAIIIICLPTADSLSSLDLISLTTALVTFVLMVDLYGNLCDGDKFFSGGFGPEEKKKCTYMANCKVAKRRRQEIEKALHRGEKVSLADILKRHSSMSSIDTEEGDEGWHGGHF